MSGPEGTVPKDPQRFRNAASMPEYDSPATSVSRHPQEVRPRCRRRPRTCLTHGWEPGMVTITSLAKDEKDARIALAAVLEPDDAVTGRLLAAVGAVETVRLAAGTGVLPETIDPVEGELWRGKVAPRMATVAAVNRAREDTGRLGFRVILPGDDDWPVALNDLRERAPLCASGARHDAVPRRSTARAGDDHRDAVGDGVRGARRQ